MNATFSRDMPRKLNQAFGYEKKESRLVPRDSNLTDVFAAGATNGNGTLTIACSLDPADQGAQKLVPYIISLSTGSSGSFVQRTMKSGTNALGYNLYTSNTYSVVWGDGTGSTSTQSGSHVLNGGHPTLTSSFTAYGRIPALQDVAVASDYRDNVTATVTW